jgi:hypothetical protein
MPALPRTNAAPAVEAQTTKPRRSVLKMQAPLKLAFFLRRQSTVGVFEQDNWVASFTC